MNGAIRLGSTSPVSRHSMAAVTAPHAPLINSMHGMARALRRTVLYSVERTRASSMNQALRPRKTWLLAFSCLLASCAANDRAVRTQELRDQVTATEIAFAATMADRDFDAFAAFIADDAIFYSGDTALRGKDAVLTAWKPHFDAHSAPFSWRPASVEVLASGDLAFSTGPVHDPGGNLIATFNSVWKRRSDGTWLIVFDKGCSACSAR